MKHIVRTQIYLTAELKAELDRLAERKGAPMTQLVREAVEQYVKKETPVPSAAEAMLKVAGMWAHRKDIPDGVTYQRRLRAEWERRLRRIYGKKI